MLGQLIPVGGGDPIPLLKPELIVGRRPSCDIRLDFSNISSRHCRLEYVHGYWRATDISRNGTKVNGERIDEKFLQPGDTVSFAKHSFEVQYTPEPDAIAPQIEEIDPFAMSLLEKAGLAGNERRDRSRSRDQAHPQNRSNSGSRSPLQPELPPRKPGRPADIAIKPPISDDDRALEWLGE